MDCFEMVSDADSHSPVGRLLRFCVTVVAVISCAVGCNELERPKDNHVVSNYLSNEACFQQMADSLLSVREGVVVKTGNGLDAWLFGGQFLRRDNIGNLNMWKVCSDRTGVIQVFSGSQAEQIASRTGSVASLDQSGRAVWFTLHANVLSGGVEKGVLYSADDSADALGIVVPSTDEYAQRHTVLPNQYVLRKIKLHWYVYYYVY